MGDEIKDIFDSIGWRRIAEDIVGDGTYWISTVKLPDFGMWHDTELGNYETMVLDKSTNELGTTVDMRRYATEKDAIAGHKLFVEVFSRRAAKGTEEKSEASKLTLEIELKDKLIEQLQNENAFLKQEYAKATETLNRSLLSPPQKMSIRDRLRRRSE
jgi:hypothetical protein